MENTLRTVEEFRGDNVDVYSHVNLYKSISFDEQIKSRANNVVTAFYRDKNLEHDIEIGKAKRINQSSVRQHQLLADLPASTGSN